MDEPREIKINAEQWIREQETQVPLTTTHRFGTKEELLRYLASVEDADIIHMWDMDGYWKAAIIHRGVIAAFQRGRRIDPSKLD